MLPYESQLLTLFLHCVLFSFVWAFYYLKQIGKQNRREQIATFDCVSVSTLTQSNDFYRATINGHHCNTTPL